MSDTYTCESYRGTATWRERLAWRLRIFADRIDRRHAIEHASPYRVWWSARERRYIVRDDGIGAPIWHYPLDYKFAWVDAPEPKRGDP